MKRLLIVLMLGTVLFSCNEKKISANSSEVILLSKMEDLPKSTMEFDITKSSIVNNQLRLTVAHGGGCDPKATFKIYQIPKQTYDCNVIDLYIVFTTNNLCKRLDYTDLTFDLSSYALCYNKLIIKGGNKNMEVMR